MSFLMRRNCLGVVKNHLGKFSSNVNDTVHKTGRKAGRIFSSKFTEGKLTPIVHIKLTFGIKRVFLPGCMVPKYSV